MNLHAYNDFIVVSKIDDTDAITGLLENIFANENANHFSFLNIHKEVPVLASALICGIEPGSIEFITSLSQLAAIQESGEVLIQSTFLNIPLIGYCQNINPARKSVTLHNFSFAEVDFTRISSAKLRLKSPMNINLEVENNKVSGVIKDVSIKGVCVNTFAGDILEHASNISLIIKLVHGKTYQLVETKIPSRVTRLDRIGVQYHCEMDFQHTAESEKILTMFIFQRQLEIIKKLEDKFA